MKETKEMKMNEGPRIKQISVSFIFKEPDGSAPKNAFDAFSAFYLIVDNVWRPEYEDDANIKFHPFFIGNPFYDCGAAEPIRQIDKVVGYRFSTAFRRSDSFVGFDDRKYNGCAIVDAINKNPSPFLEGAANFAINLVSLCRKAFENCGAGFRVFANISYTGRGARNLSKRELVLWESPTNR